MKFDELNEDQKMCAKQDYMIRLADKGRFIEVIYGPGNGPARDPSYGELAEADRLVSDEMMRREGVDYVPDDFNPVTDHYDPKHPSRWEEIEIRLRNRASYARFIIENPEYQPLKDTAIGKVLSDVFLWVDLKISIECDRARKTRAEEVSKERRHDCMKRWIVTVVDKGDTCDGKARTLAVCETEEDARAFVRNDMEKCVYESTDCNGNCLYDVVDFDKMTLSAHGGDTGCEWNIEERRIK